MTEIIDIITEINEFLLLESDEQYRACDDAEYWFHELKDNNMLHALLLKFPRYEKVMSCISKEVLKPEPLNLGWEEKLLDDVNALINALINAFPEQHELGKLNGYVYGKYDYNSDGMFELRRLVLPFLRRYKDPSISTPQFNFLSNFFFGVDWLYWTSWSVLSLYSDAEVTFDAILNVCRNCVDFTVQGDKLVISKSPSC